MPRSVSDCKSDCLLMVYVTHPLLLGDREDPVSDLDEGLGVGHGHDCELKLAAKVAEDRREPVLGRRVNVPGDLIGEQDPPLSGHDDEGDLQTQAADIGKAPASAFENVIYFTVLSDVEISLTHVPALDELGDELDVRLKDCAQGLGDDPGDFRRQ